MSTRVTLTDQSRRGTIYDRSGTVILATTLDRSRLVASPLVMPTKKAEVFETILASAKVSATLRNFFKVVAEAGRLNLLRDLNRHARARLGLSAMTQASFLRRASSSRRNHSACVNSSALSPAPPLRRQTALGWVPYL